MQSPDRLDIVPEHVADPVRRPPWRTRLLWGGGDLVLSLVLNGAVVGWLAGIGFPLRAIVVPEAISVDLVDHVPGDAGAGGARPGDKGDAAAAGAAPRTAQAAEPAPVEAENAPSAKPPEPPPSKPAPQSPSGPAAQPSAPPSTSDTAPPAAPDPAPASNPKLDTPAAVPPPPEQPDDDPRARLVEAPVAQPPAPTESRPESRPGAAAQLPEQQTQAVQAPDPPTDDAGRPADQAPVQSAAGGDGAVPPPAPPEAAPKPLTAEQRRQAENTATLAAMLPFGSGIGGSPFQAQAPAQGASTAYRGEVYANFNKAQDVIADARARHLKGQAVVAFTVDDRGGLASIGIAVSSRNPAVDQAALDLIRRAAPFPPPPPGAQRTFSPAIGLGLDE